MDVVAALKKVPFLSDLSEEHLRQIAQTGKTLTMSEGGIVFRAGDESDSLYVILEGKVKIFLRDSGGHEVELKSEEAGDFFGELALLDGGQRSATVATITASVFFVLERPAFLALISQTPQLVTRVFSALSQDIRKTTERYFTEEMERQQLQTEMELARHRALSQMVAGVAHELNTPLGIIHTAASVIRGRLTSSGIDSLPMDTKTRGMVQDVLDAAGLLEGNIVRAHKLVEDFKNISVSQIVDTLENLDLPTVVEDIVGLFRVSARKARIDVEFLHNLPAHNRHWRGYRGYLTQVLMNLLTNIERYAYPNNIGGKVDIAITADHERDQPAFIVIVRDFGAGIPAENLDKVFDMFYTTGRSIGGTGLGLPIVQNIVTTALQGTITLESHVGEGTIVMVTFPQQIREAVSDQPPAIR